MPRQATRADLGPAADVLVDANHPLYQSLGYREIGAIPVPGADSHLRPMWREPTPKFG